jgi:hypothetical protein
VLDDKVSSTQMAEGYIVARSVLLDALGALAKQRKAVILVGAQAIYLHTGKAGLAVAEYTYDADIVLNPSSLSSTPLLNKAMESVGFTREITRDGQAVGIWTTLRDINGVPSRVTVDLLIPEKIGGHGRRAARLLGQPKGVVLKVPGLEGCLLDHSSMMITAFDSADSRSYDIEVAGPSSLLVSKLIKLKERTDAVAEGKRDRTANKDALDVLRILRASNLAEIASILGKLCEEEISAEITRRAIVALPELFGTSRSLGSRMAADAAAPLEDFEVITQSCAVLANRLEALINIKFPLASC